MKNSLLTLLLLTIGTISVAQSTNSAEVALKEFIAENAVSFYNFFNDRLTSDFRHINPKGSISSRADVLKTTRLTKIKVLTVKYRT